MATQHPSEAAVVPLEAFEADTLVKLFLHPIDVFDRPDAMLHRVAGEWRPISHRDVLRRVDALAAGLDGLGIGRNDRVAILSENRPEWAIADFAVLGLGGTDVPLYATLPPNQIAYILRDCEARAIFVSTAEQRDKIREIREEVPGLEHVIVFDTPPGPGEHSLEALIARGTERIDAQEFPGVRALAGSIGRDDLATLIYTSGTTGDPKGVMLTHENIASNVAATKQHRVFELHPGMVALSFLPLSHSFERMVDYFYWFSGATIAYVGDVERVGESMLEVRPHVLAAAPRVFEKIYSRVMGATGVKKLLVGWAKRVGEAGVEPRLSGRKRGPSGAREKLADRLVFSKLRAKTGGRIEGFVSGSAPLSADIARFFWAAGLPIYEGYGLTETSPVLSANRPGGVRLGSVGTPLPGTEIRISEEGEILARGPQIMKGYYNNPDATTETVDSDGWLHTGDVGVLEEGGFLRITDRIKNLIVTAGGKNIAPSPIENRVSMSPFVSQVVLIGDRRPFPALLVVPDLENLTVWAREQGLSDVSPEGLSQEPRVQAIIESDALSRLDGLARYETPKKVVVIWDDFTVAAGELTPTMKIRRQFVEAKYADLIEEIYQDR